MIAITVGLIIGLTLGLTGAGGAAFALPLLILVIGMPVQQAIGLSLATVALSAGYGAIRRAHSGDVFWWGVLLLSAGGMIAAPGGKYLSTLIPDAWLLTGFTLLCMMIARHMWRLCRGLVSSHSISLCQFSANGSFQPQARSIGALAVSGLGVGSLAGLFGVGGGFLIVPLLHSVMGLSMRRAIATSLLIIALIASSGFVAHTYITPVTDWHLLLQLGGGAVAGMLLGSKLAERFSTNQLQKGFAVALLCLAGATLTNAWL